MQEITSVQNPRIRALRALKKAQARTETGLFLVEGRKLCEEALRDAQVQTLLVDSRFQEQYAALLKRAGEVLVVPAHVLEAVCQARTPQGIAASVHMPAPLRLEQAGGLLLALDGVQDPGNVGAMLRTAEAAGFAGVLLSPQCADAFSPKAARATMGSVLRLPLWRGPLAQGLEALRGRGFTIVTAELGGEDFFDALQTLQAPLVLVIGSEGNGVTPQVSALAQKKLALAMYGRAESLNAAVAAGILMYAAGRAVREKGF